MNFRKLIATNLTFVVFSLLGFALAQSSDDTPDADDRNPAQFDRVVRKNSAEMLETGRHIFRHGTFGDETFWGDTLKLHQAIEGVKFGGVGVGVSPRTALAVGLKVDVDALPKNLVEALQHGQVDLGDSAIASMDGPTGISMSARLFRWRPIFNPSWICSTRPAVISP